MLKISITSILLAFFLCVSGCVSSMPGLRVKTDAALPVVDREIIRDTHYEDKDPAAKAGLYEEALARNFFQDLRAHQTGDLVTVNIVETSSASKKAGTKTSRESNIDAGIDSLLGWENKIKHLTSFGNKKVRNAYNNNSIFKGSISNGFTGSGTTTRDESMTASITARVMEVMPNGNLFIKGSREVKVNNETQYIILSGFIRPVDISPDNTILSSYIGDAKIEYVGKGPVSDKQRPGWLARAVDLVWPF
ncbi:MAG: flagellar basal body L-ring protein FlgH [Deltaproteobacteria bacterium]|nr:flagellar basal body L-ring protein FlgH [Deltaproteobacteria bacterium]